MVRRAHGDVRTTPPSITCTGAKPWLTRMYTIATNFLLGGQDKTTYNSVYCFYVSYHVSALIYLKNYGTIVVV